MSDGTALLRPHSTFLQLHWSGGSMFCSTFFLLSKNRMLDSLRVWTFHLAKQPHSSVEMLHLWSTTSVAKVRITASVYMLPILFRLLHYQGGLKDDVWFGKLDRSFRSSAFPQINVFWSPSGRLTAFFSSYSRALVAKCCSESLTQKTTIVESQWRLP